MTEHDDIFDEDLPPESRSRIPIRRRIASYRRPDQLPFAALRVLGLKGGDTDVPGVA